MNSSAGFSPSQQSLALKRDYRILRSKVLKILDKKFYQINDDAAQYDTRIAQIETAFNKIRDRDLVENKGLVHKLPKVLDYVANKPETKGLKHSASEKHSRAYKDLETLKIENLCKYLSPQEIELICEDPIYFLGREEYRVNSELNDHKGWNRQLVVVHEKKIKEDNWKDTMTKMHTEFRKTPQAEFVDTLAVRTHRQQRDIDFESRKEDRESRIRIQTRKIMARNNQMNALVKIRKAEEREVQNEQGYDWEFKIKDRFEKVMEKKNEALELRMQERKDNHMEIRRKLFAKEKEKTDQLAIEKMTQEIDSYFKEKATEKIRTKNIQSKINKARTFTSFESRKPMFLAKIGAERHFEISPDQSGSTFK